MSSSIFENEIEMGDSAPEVMDVRIDDCDKSLNHSKDEETELTLVSPPHNLEDLQGKGDDAENPHDKEDFLMRRSRARGSVTGIIGGDAGSVLPRLNDHFSLEMPSSSVRFRHAHIRVFEQANNQFIMEETSTKDEDGRVKGTNVAVKYVNNATTGLKMLRAGYSLVSVFVGGFIFIFCLMLLLFLFVDLASKVGAGEHKSSQTVIGFVGALLSVPVFVYGLSSMMAMVASFVGDTWNGHTFLRTFGNWKVVITEWISFTIFLGIPLVTMTITLFAKLDDWWAVSLLTWFSSILALFVFFAACLLFYDISACLYLIEHVDDPHFGQVPDSKWKILVLMRQAILLRQVYQWSGDVKKNFTIAGKMDTTEDNFAKGRDASSEYMSLYDHATQLNCCGKFFTEVNPPKRIYSLEEVLGISPFITSRSWSLEKIFCRDRKRTRAVTVITGPSALTPEQFKSSFACAILGGLLSTIVPLGLLFWMGYGAGLIVVVLVIITLCCLPTYCSTWHIRNQYKKLINSAEERKRREEKKRMMYENAGQRSKMLLKNRRKKAAPSAIASEAVYQVVESYHISRPSRTFCYAVFFAEVCFFFLWPLILLFVAGNWQMGILFLCIGFFSLVRHYLNASVILQELGNFAALGSKNVFGVNLTSKRDMDSVMDKEWKAKSRLSAIISNVSRGKARVVFTWIFGIFVLVVLGLFFAAATHQNTNPAENARNFNLLNDFYYEERPNLPYPTCQMGKGLEIPGYKETALVDYAFIGSITYAGDNAAQLFLDGYFGENKVINNPHIVQEFKEKSENVGSPAIYKYLTVEDRANFGLVSVRGTVNAWDMLADAQLWGTAALFQVLRAFLPVGDVFTPILHQIIQFVTTLETQNIGKVSYYKEISAFIKYLEDTEGKTDIRVTGHSLGGGLALISGAQTKHPAIGLSAPNAMLSRRTFSPPVTVGELNNFTFNIVPNRDLVPRIDDVADLFQRIECRTDANNFLGCHAVS